MWLTDLQVNILVHSLVYGEVNVEDVTVKYIFSELKRMYMIANLAVISICGTSRFGGDLNAADEILMALGVISMRQMRSVDSQS